VALRVSGETYGRASVALLCKTPCTRRAITLPLRFFRGLWASWRWLAGAALPSCFVSSWTSMFSGKNRTPSASYTAVAVL